MCGKEYLGQEPFIIELIHKGDFGRELIGWLNVSNDCACFGQAQNTIDCFRWQTILVCDQEEGIRIDANSSRNEADLVGYFHTLQMDYCSKLSFDNLT